MKPPSQPTSIGSRAAVSGRAVAPQRRTWRPNASAARVVERSEPYCRPAGVSALGSPALAWLRRRAGDHAGYHHQAGRGGPRPQVSRCTRSWTNGDPLGSPASITTRPSYPPLAPAPPAGVVDGVTDTVGVATQFDSAAAVACERLLS